MIGSTWVSLCRLSKEKYTLYYVMQIGLGIKLTGTSFVELEFKDDLWENMILVRFEIAFSSRRWTPFLKIG